MTKTPSPATPDTATPDTTTRSHEHRVTIDAAPDTVWRAITDAEELTRWFPLGADVEPGPGGSLTYRWGDLVGACRIDVWEPPRHLRTSWMEHGQPGDGPRPTVVDWFLEGRQGRTVLRLVHSGFGRDARWDEEYEGTRRGWTFELRGLRHYLERHAGRPRHAFWIRQTVDLDARRVWDRFQAPGGLLRDGRLDGLAAGDRYRLVLSTGDVVEGTVVMTAPPFELAGTVEGLDDGLVRFGYENCGNGPEAFVWLSTWGLPSTDVEALETRWTGALRDAFAGATVGT